MLPVTEVIQQLSIKEREDFGPSAWKQRRKIIFWTLIVCAGAFIGLSLTTIILLIASVFYPEARNFDANLIGLASTIIWASVSTATTVILGYVFGANMDSKDFRKNIGNIPGIVATPVATPVTPTPPQTEPPIPPYQQETDEGPKG